MLLRKAGGFLGVLSGGQERDRTADTRIFSPWDIAFYGGF